MAKRIKISPKECDFFLARNSQERKNFASIALKNHLFVNGWMLQKELKGIVGGDDSDIVLVVFCGIPVGVHICDDCDYGMWYVKPAFRKNGLAQKLTEIMKGKHKVVKAVGIGRADCVGFFYQVGIPLRP